MKFFKILSILSGLFVCIVLISISLGWIKFFSAISPLMIGFNLLAFSTAISLNSFEQTGIKWFSFSLAFVGFLILLMGVFQIIELSIFWQYGMTSLSTSIVLGLFSQTKLVTISRGKFYYFGLLLTLIMLILLSLYTLQVDNSNVFYFGKITLIILTIFALVGSILKPKKSN